MKKIAQKGFSVIEIILVVVVVGLIGTVGWLVWDRQQDKTGDNQQTPDTTHTEHQEADTTEEQEAGAYSIDLSSSKNPTTKTTSYSDFGIHNAGGDVMVYNQSSGKFQEGAIDFNASSGPPYKIDQKTAKDMVSYTTGSDGTPIYLWVFGDAGSYLDTYVIDLKNGKILTIEFSYRGITDIEPGPNEMTETEITAQRAKDLAAVKTFKFL